MFTPLEAVLLKIGKAIESCFWDTFLKVLDSFPSGFNSLCLLGLELKFIFKPMEAS